MLHEDRVCFVSVDIYIFYIYQNDLNVVRTRLLQESWTIQPLHVLQMFSLHN